MGLVLASSSPRRERLLREAGLPFEVRAPDAEEVLSGDPMRDAVTNARAKAGSVQCSPGELVLGADTIVTCGGNILGKPRDETEARGMIDIQLGQPQKVITGVCLIDPGSGREFEGCEVSGVVLRGSGEDVERYLASGLWKGKAGAYGIQDEGGLIAELLWGEMDNVVGLPMTLVRRLLSLTEFQYPPNTPSQ